MSHIGQERPISGGTEKQSESGDDRSDKSSITRVNSLPQHGVLTAEGAKRLASNNKVHLLLAWLGIGLVSYVNGLDNNTNYAWIGAATQRFDAYLLYPTVTVMQQVLIGVMKLPVAKLSDVFGRAEVYAMSIVLYMLGFVVMSVSQRISDLFGGVVLQAIGSTGTQIMQQIVIADWVPAEWRGLAIGLVSAPYIINFAVAPKIVGALCDPSTCAMATSGAWRWGTGMFTILLPVAAAPIILVLAINQSRARRQGIVAAAAEATAAAAMTGVEGERKRAEIAAAAHVPITAAQLVKEIDLVGLFFIVAGWLLLLIPLNIYKMAPNGWQTGYIIAMLVLGISSLIAAGIWEGFFASRPLIRKTYIINKDVIIPTLIGFFDFLSFYTSWLPAYYWVMITFDWSIEQATYFSNAQSLCLTVFGIAVGYLAYLTKRYKPFMVFGAIIRMLGIGLMVRYRTPDSTTAQVVIPQILQGLGGGFLGILLQVTAQVNVPHQDVAMVTAFVLLLTEIGGAVGSAVWGAIQNEVLTDRLAVYLPQLDATALSTIVNSPFSISTTYAMGTPERDAIIAAWGDAVHTSLMVSIATAAVPLILSCFISNKKLGKIQNLVASDVRKVVLLDGEEEVL